MVFWKTALTLAAAALCAGVASDAGAVCRWQPCQPANYSDAWCAPGWGTAYSPAYERRVWVRPYVPAAAWSYDERSGESEEFTPSVHEHDYLHYN